MSAAAPLGRLPRALLLGAIRFYKRFVSPRKGYGCAYRVHTGCASCSTLGYRAVARYGVFRGLGVLGLRLDQCRLKHERHGARRSVARRAQAGFVDCDVPCDGSCVDASSCDALSCESLGCDALACGPCDGIDDCDCAGNPCGRTRRPGVPVRERGRRRRGTPPAGSPDALPGPEPGDGEGGGGDPA